MADRAIIVDDIRWRSKCRNARQPAPMGSRPSSIGFLMCLPLIALIAAMVIYPALYAIYLSMLNKKMTQFVGLSNYAFLLKRNTFQLVIFQSCFFAISAVILKATIGFILAHLMHNISGSYQRIWRGLFLVPWVIPLALSTLGWQWLFDSSYSAFNWVLNAMGFQSVPWLGEGWIARFCVIAVNVWYGTPFFMIMYLAGLKSVPEHLYEAATIDGASAMQKLFFVTLPMMRNIISITVLFSLIVTFADFDIVRILTAGGPQDMTHIFATYAFAVGLQSGDIPLGASVSLFMLPILAVCALLRPSWRDAAQQGNRGMSGATATSSTGALAGRRRGFSLAAQRRWALWGSYAALAVFVVMFLAPPFFMVMTSLKTSAEISAQQGNPWLAHQPTLRNFSELIADSNFQHFFLNSAVVTICVVVISMVIAVPAAFSLARIGFWGSQLLATGVFLTYLIPGSLLFIPLFQIVGALGLINNVWCLVLVYPTLAVPFCTWIMIGYFSSIPKELDEAALIDGATYMQILFRIFIPVAMPGIIAAMIFVFTVSWGQFLYPMAYLYTSNQMVLTVGIITDLIRGDVFQWGKIMAGCIIAAAPPVIVYAFLMDYYIAGLTAGATKG